MSESAHPLLRALRSPYLLVVLAMLCWSTNWLLGRALRAEVSPVGLAFWRWLVAALILLPFAGRELWDKRALLLRRWKLLLLLSVTGMALFHSLVYLALRHTQAINASLFNSATPIAILVFSWLLFRERATGRQVLGIVVSLAGVVGIVTRGDPTVLRELGFNPGDLWALVAVMVISIYTVMLRRRPEALSPIAFLAAIAWPAVLLLLPVYLWQTATGPGFAVTATPETALAVLYLGTVPSILAYLLWIRSVGALGANRAGVFSHLHPFFTSLFAITLLGETLALYHVLSFALILSGIWLATTRRLLPGRRGIAPAAMATAPAGERAGG